ncbi:MAG: hypothetical protein H6581_05055 [Bacteroidia bacterium]|nr:hypothetical protein [Bacteroidia bacterium]
MPLKAVFIWIMLIGIGFSTIPHDLIFDAADAGKELVEKSSSEEKDELEKEDYKLHFQLFSLQLNQNFISLPLPSEQAKLTSDFIHDLPTPPPKKA